jgi:hypothetical protein
MNIIRYRYTQILLPFLLSILWIFSAMDAIATDFPGKTTGQSVYVPAYSHIYHGNKEAQLLLSVTLSIRNIDPENSISISAVDYYETNGKLLKHFIHAPVTLGPLGSERYIIPQNDSSGGSNSHQPTYHRNHNDRDSIPARHFVHVERAAIAEIEVFMSYG